MVSNIQNEEQMFVKGTDEEKEEILNQDVNEVNVLKVIESDGISEKSREDDIGNENEKNDMVIMNKDEDDFNGFKVKETSFDFKIFDIPKVDDKEK
ncbi:hypothetical protein Tco_1389032 [Tanacetum coccineum]